VQSQQCRLCAVTLLTSAGTAPAKPFPTKSPYRSARKGWQPDLWSDVFGGLRSRRGDDANRRTFQPRCYSPSHSGTECPVHGPSYWRTLRADGFRRCRSSVRPPVQTTKPPAVERTDGFALSPYVPFFRTASLGCRNRAVKFAAAFTCVPPFRSKRSGTPLVRPRKRTTPRRSHRYLSNIMRRWHVPQKGNCIATSNSEQTVSRAWIMFIRILFIFCRSVCYG